MQYAHRDIVNKLAEGLAEVATYRMFYDPQRMVTVVEGEVWVEEPSGVTTGRII